MPGAPRYSSSSDEVRFLQRSMLLFWWPLAARTDKYVDDKAFAVVADVLENPYHHRILINKLSAQKPEGIL
jgi:hypothetical protein